MVKNSATDYYFDLDPLSWLSVYYPSLYLLLNSRKGIFEHSYRSMKIGSLIANELGLNCLSVDVISKGLLTHDVGKAYWPKDFFFNSSLSEDDYFFIKLHCEAGFNLLSSLGYLPAAAEIALKHHERLNGSGYPGGFSGDSLSIEVKVSSVADCYEALTGFREYRSFIYSPEEALDILFKDVALYDPLVLEALSSLLKAGCNF